MAKQKRKSVKRLNKLVKKFNKPLQIGIRFRTEREQRELRERWEKAMKSGHNMPLWM